MLNEDLQACLDWGINKPTQNFRTPGSVKNGRKKRVNVKYHTHADVFITNIPIHAMSLKLIAPKMVTTPINCPAASPEQLEQLCTLIDGNVWSENRLRSHGNKIVFTCLKASQCEICLCEHSRTSMYVCMFDTCIRQFCYCSEGNPKPNKVLWEAPVQANIANILASPDSFSDYNKFVGKRVQLADFKQWVHNTIAFIINGGNSMYVTKNYVSGEINYKYVKEFKHLKAITYPNTNHNADDENSKELCKVAMTKIINSMEPEIAYDRIDFIPYFITPPVDNVFNLFTGFAHKYNAEFIVDAGVYQLITDHIYNIWCG